MGATAGEYRGVGRSEGRRTVPTFTVVSLLKAMQDIGHIRYRAEPEVNTTMDRVAEMGQTGAKVVETARQQGEKVVDVTQSVNQIAWAVEEMNRAVAQAAVQSVGGAGRRAGRQPVGGFHRGRHALHRRILGTDFEIIGVITEIAEQTNLLALNAAIEPLALA